MISHMKGTRRGYSILAALVFVGILGSVAAAVHIAAPSSGQSAAAIFAAVNPAGNGLDAQKLLNQQSQGQLQKCNPGYDYKIKRAAEGKPQVIPVPVCPPGGTPTGPQNTQVLPASASLAVAVFGKPDDSRCQTNPQTKKLEPKSDYKCKVQYCVQFGRGKEECKDADDLAVGGIDPDQIDKNLRGQVIKDFVARTPGDELKSYINGSELNSADQSSINDAFKERTDRADSLRTEVQSLQDDNDRINARLEDLSYGCHNYILPHNRNPACRELETLEATKLANEKRVEDLTKQLDALKNQQVALSPAQNPNQLPTNVPNPEPRPCTGLGCDANSNNPNQQPCTGGNCQQTFNPNNGPGNNGPGNNGPGNNGPGSNGPGGSGGNPLGSLLQGLMSRLLGNQGQQCSSDPNQYQQQQQQYQQQMQQYQYQMQQYQYYQQQSLYSGQQPPPPPQPPQACTPNSQQNTCAPAPSQPTSGCSNGSWQPVRTQQGNGYQCTTGWQCGPSNVPQPTAQLTCEPKVAEPGMSVALSFACSNATGSTGSGLAFSTDNRTSGTTTVALTNPPEGARGVTFGLACTNQNLTGRAECEVELVRPLIALVATPKNVTSGEASRVGWTTAGMQSCVISSPQMPGFTMQNAEKKTVNGTATTSPLTRDTTVVLTCQTIGGNTKVASTTITVGGAASTTVLNVSSSIDGKQDVKHGSSATITWEAPSAPSNSAVGLWLVDVQTNQVIGLIAQSLNTTGSHVWTLPATSTSCSTNPICGADLVVGRTYKLQASLYSPANANLSSSAQPTYLDEDYTETFKISN